MIAAVLLLAVGLGDLARRRIRGTAQPIVGLIVAAATLLVAGVGYAGPLGIAPVATGIAALVATVWMLTVRIDDKVTPPLWPAALLIVALTLGATFTPWDAEPVRLTPGAPELAPGVVVAALAVVTSLMTTANLITRSMLQIARGSHPGLGVRPEPRWVLRRGTRRALVIEREEGEPTAERTPSTLQGGRIIGPLERLLIVALALVGAQGLIAALLAAKGIVRFPEISADRRLGSKAEEFLIGSLTSWSLAGLAVALVARASGAL